MTRLEISESVQGMITKLFSTVLLWTTALFPTNHSVYEILRNNHLSIEYFYWGAVGQIVYTLYRLKQKIDSTSVIENFSIKGVVSMFLGIFLAPIMSMIVTSVLANMANVNYNLFMGVTAFGLGMGLDKSFSFIDSFTNKQIRKSNEKDTINS